MHGADPRAGEHQRDGLEVRRHVDRDSVAALDADSAQRGGDALDLPEQLRIGEDPLLAVFVEGDQRGASAVAIRDLRIETGVREIGFAADEPAERGNLLGRPLEDLIPLAKPGNPRCGLRPEGLRLVEGAALDLADDWPDQIDV